METSTSRPQITFYVFGLFLTAISLLFFSFPFFMDSNDDTRFGAFLPSYCLALVYIIFLWANGRLRKGRNGLFPLFMFLILALISCYSLNRSVPIFAFSTNWFAAVLTIVCINFAALYFFDKFPRWLQHVSLFVLGISLIVFIYLAMYLSPLYGIGAAMFLFVGLSLHVFVPLLFVVYGIVFLVRASRNNKRNLWTALSGSGAALLFILFFVLQWNSTINTINKTYREATAAENDGLPEWVYVSQKIPHNWITEKAFKTNIVYFVPGNLLDLSITRMPKRNFSDERQHDPLVAISTFFCGQMNLDDDTRIKVLESMYGARHESLERLWSGQDLLTEIVNTSIDIWPQFGLSYTEKLITVSNMARKRGWRDEQEAIYTFHLPEGAVVTALSLWIEGAESKGILTTKEKAANAYNTIVGRERRDPSVVHWQEGNTVSVRVFPVLAGESRKFKLGITSPLKRSATHGIYENIYFEGPQASDAKELVTINFKDNPSDFIIPASFSVKGKNSFSLQRAYEPRWTLNVTDQPLSTNAFSFDGKTYSIRPYAKQAVAIKADNIYLDINKSWSWEDFNAIYKTAAKRKVYVYTEKLEQLTAENKDELFYQLQKQPFSLFPFFHIADKTNSLVITKNDGLSPNIKDLKDSRYMGKLKTSLADSSSKILLYDLGEGLSPYLKTLKEYRVFRYEQGKLGDLINVIADNKFAVDMEGDNQVVIEQAGITIQQTEGATASTAPDHLMRLFAYNHIMQKMGTRLITDTTVDHSLIEESAKAYVVSPVSSLVVLESKKDYDRFDIKETENSLKNASHNDSGSVPEPHEWALIIIALLTLAYAKYSRTKNKVA